eukprot:TRINITY_DN8694_c0_g5_i1.p1 TRINITY_DN8694_c0_g5~~TRINITY_DN8694_c0_g5_i1.p1  ORF type:complete len:146 (+),score=35.65 TRINITY_DN8694_c0_g5_i1:159-596(+)
MAVSCGVMPVPSPTEDVAGLDGEAVAIEVPIQEENHDEAAGEDCCERVQAERFTIIQEGDKRVLYREGIQVDLGEATRLFTLSSDSDGSRDEEHARRAEMFQLLFGRTMPQAARASTMVAEMIAQAEKHELQPAPRSMSEPVKGG